MRDQWLGLLQQLAPGVTPLAVLRIPREFRPGWPLGVTLGGESSFAVELIPLGMRDAAEIDGAVTAFAAAQMTVWS